MTKTINLHTQILIVFSLAFATFRFQCKCALKAGLFSVDSADVAIRIPTQYVAATESVNASLLPPLALERLSQVAHTPSAVIYLFTVLTALGRLYFATFDSSLCSNWISSVRSWFGHVSLNYGEPVMSPTPISDLTDLYDRLECILELMLAPVNRLRFVFNFDVSHSLLFLKGEIDPSELGKCGRGEIDDRHVPANVRFDTEATRTAKEC